MESIKGLKRTKMCGEFTPEDIGKKVTVMGWVNKVRNLGSLIFIDLRDRSGIIQLVANDKDAALYEKAKALRLEFVIAAVGELKRRAPEAVNPKMPTGEIEIAVEELRIINKASTPPFVITDETEVKDELRLKYRYLDLRRLPMQQALILRHKVAKIARDYFNENGFLEIETPMLIKSTPEGARDYLVPSRVHPGKFYALPQSPQLYKQLLMVAGMDRYFQLARCFRDEDLRADRQPEFTQIDLEMSFVDADDVMSINEGFLKRVFAEILNIDLKLPLPRLTYEEAMNRYGSDKPDMRFEMELVDLSQIVKKSGFKVFSDACASGGSVKGITVKGGAVKLGRRDLDSLTEFAKLYKAKGLVWIILSGEGIKSPIAKFLSEDEINSIIKAAGAETGDTILIVADKNEVVFGALGNLRLEVAKRLDIIPKDRYNLLWVTEFPLLEYSKEEKRYIAMHHPFTSPLDEDIPLLDSDPLKVRAKAYDIVLNGLEIGGGSIRISNSELQQKMFDLLGFTKEEADARFGYLLEAFKYGTPPHGGMAYGFDRLVMVLANKESIRDVIAFPKVQNASDLMTNAPDTVYKEQLDELHIQIKSEK